jgi:hypothetical protein
MQNQQEAQMQVVQQLKEAIVMFNQAQTAGDQQAMQQMSQGLAELAQAAEQLGIDPRKVEAEVMQEQQTAQQQEGMQQAAAQQQAMQQPMQDEPRPEAGLGARPQVDPTITNASKDLVRGLRPPEQGM